VTRVGEILIRPYESTDRDGVRKVCYETGFMGERVDWLWRDEESFCDMFSAHWTDNEPELAIVAVLDDVVVGYLLGSMDSRSVANAGKLVAHHAFARGMLISPGTAGFFWRMIGDGIADSLRHRLPPPTYYDERWPAHLHIDLQPVCRGQGVGAALVRGWLDTLRKASVRGCHLQTMAENHKAIAFFEAMGFTKRGEPRGAPGFRTRSGERMSVQLMVQPLDGAAKEMSSDQ
jgi:ribosomal protein S18 acetylase RimI-like enzyme